MKPSVSNHRSSFAGFLITLGIVFGDIGTSPLYVIKAIVSGASAVNEGFILGGLSAIFWTITLQTTIKYIVITLRADNKGEGGIFSLFALVRKRAKWAYILALIGGATLLADGVITPSLTILSSVEGLQNLNPRTPVIPIAIIILTGLFLFQRFGTKVIGKFFGPMMLIWFVMLAILGIVQLTGNLHVFVALSPAYAYRFLVDFPEGFALLGAVFLATTGAEAMYSDLGHCGLKNIRISWIFVKTALLLNYFGQGAWVLKNPTAATDGWTNPFYAIMPGWFLPLGIVIATAAAIIASQALISGSYTLISEAISLNFWPRIRIKYPTSIKGQLYISSINWALFILCIFVILFFQRSSNMEAAYGLSITITMLMTTALLSVYLHQKKISVILIGMMLAVFITIETAFLLANLQKFIHGGWFTIVLGGILFGIMYIWRRGRKIKNNFTGFVNVEKYFDLFSALHSDTSIPRYATQLVFLTKANRIHDIEMKIVYSILNKQPKRAEVYWFLHVDILDEPYVHEYKVTSLIPDLLFKVDFKLGFKVQPRINLFFRQVVDEMVRNHEIDLTSPYNSLRQYKITGDFKFVLIDRIQNYDFDFSPVDQFIMDQYFWLKRLGIADLKFYGLDSSNVVEETVPLQAETHGAGEFR
ncbi:MAG: KUP/HAK/KT family potassium transporter [Bacteroidales bacterium]|nr:KUP/HAK/KT family potassium transporter [Bacteroidales bacterium]